MNNLFYLNTRTKISQMTACDAFKKDLANCLATACNLIAGSSIEYLSSFSINTIKSDKKIKRQLLVAFSGGPDSTALLLAMQSVAPSLNFSLQACHINHSLRGVHADADAAFCERICQQLGIQCKIIKLPLEQAKRHFNEDILREMRYQQLQSFAHEQGTALILTGHTLDDQVETILFNLFRGTALTGLTGMKSCRPLDNDVYLLRPLLNISKKKCAQFVENKGVKACNDSSNLDEIYARNYMRHKIIPAITERFPYFTQQIHSMQQILTGEDELLGQLTRQLLCKIESVDYNCWPLELLTSEPLALQRRAIAYALQKRAIVVSFTRIEDILSLTENNALNLNKNWRIRRHQNKLLWQQIHTSFKIDNLVPVTVKIPGLNPVPPLGMALSIERYTNKNRLAMNDTLVDLSHVKPPVILRLRQPGDLIRPLGMTQTVKLKKYLHTHKNIKAIAELAHAQILLADQEEVLWLPGGGLSEKIKVIASPSHSLRWLRLKDLGTI